MTMIIQLLVAAAAVCLSLALEQTSYKRSAELVKETVKAYTKNVLSMGDNIPLLDDSRRHFTAIAHVINYHAVQRSGCLFNDYYEEYYPYLSVSAPEAFSNPEKVVTEVRFLMDVVHNITHELLGLIDSCKQEWNICNELIEDTVHENEEQFGIPAKILFAASNVGSEYDKLSEKIEAFSKDLKGLHFVTKSPKEFENMVNALANLYRVLYPVIYSTPLECQ